MRRIDIIRGDFPLFHQDITPPDYEFFRSHSAAFKRMWSEQRRKFWSVFLDTYDDFIWNYGVMKDFPLKIEDKRMYVAEILSVIRGCFIEGTASSARTLVIDCVILAQNRHHVSALDKGSCSQNPFYMKETREVFRKLFGPPKSKSTFVKLLCGIPVYVKFAGTAINILRRWLKSTEIEDEYLEQKYLEDLARIKLPPQDLLDEEIKEEMTTDEKDAEEVRKLLAGFDQQPDLAMLIDDLAPHGHQKLVFRHGPNDVNPKMIGVGDGPIQMVNIDAGGKNEKKKKKKKKSKLPKSNPTKETEYKMPDIAPENLIDLEDNPDMFVQTIDCDTDIVMPDGRVMKPPFTFIVGKGEKPNADVLKASWDRYNAKKTKAKEETHVEEIIETIAKEETEKIETEIIEEIIETETRDIETIEEVDAASVKKKLHQCGSCNKMETDIKTFKRCVKCRGSKTPKYYCSRECQVTDWKKGHRLEHKEEQEEDVTG